MWTTENRGRYDRRKLRYPSDLTDGEWALVAPLIPLAKRGGNKRTVNVREVVNGLMYNPQHRVPVGRDPERPSSAKHAARLFCPLGSRRHPRPPAPRAVCEVP